jgi:hypothetical protein
MSRTIQLSDETYADLEAAAAANATTPAEWIAKQAARACKNGKPRKGKKPKSLYDQVKDLIGSVEGCSPQELKEDPNDPLFNILLQKKREGRL